MATAMTVGAAATGLRAWIGAHQPPWMTPRRLKLTTAAVLVAAVLAAGSQLSPNGPAERSEATIPAAAVDR